MPEAAYGIFSNNVSIRTHFGVEEWMKKLVN
jgi:hypothetical protein